jgi:hypothetical protein
MAKSRPRLEKVSEEMKAWSAMLAGEVAGWPGVNSRPMFGLTALYRNDVIFAVLPKTRGMESGNSLACKIPEASERMRKRLEADTRIQETLMQKARWFVFEMGSDADVRGALGWLSEAYEAAGKGKRKAKERSRAPQR